MKTKRTINKCKMITISFLILALLLPKTLVFADTKAGEGQVDADLEFYDPEIPKNEDRPKTEETTPIEPSVPKTNPVSKPSGVAKYLPQTGEERARWLLVSGVVVLVGILILVILKRRKEGEQNE